MVKVKVFEDDGYFRYEFDCPKDDVEFDEKGLCVNNQDCRDTANDPYYGGMNGMGLYYNCFRSSEQKEAGA